MGKAPTFGYSDVRPIKEQRESLPVFKLRDQLIQAVNEHQVSCTSPLPEMHAWVHGWFIRLVGWWWPSSGATCLAA